jgi:hypothetical protein
MSVFLEETDLNQRQGWGYSSVVLCLPSIRRPWVQSPALQKIKKNETEQEQLKMPLSLCAKSTFNLGSMCLEKVLLSEPRL